MTDFNAIQEALIGCDQDKLVGLVNVALADNIPAVDILNQGLIAGMDIVGEKMENGDMFIPEVLMAAKTMGECVTVLKPLLGEDGAAQSGSVIIGTVKGDLHDIGKNIVAMLLEGAGYEVMDLGADVSKEKFMEAVKNEGMDIIGMSALLTTTMTYMGDVIQSVVDAGLRDKIKVMVGGAPVSQSFADKINADGYAADAASAVDLVKSLLN